jgi:hypothetical protein
VREPAARVVHESWGLDFGGRLAIGFVGLSEMALGLIPIALTEPGDLGIGGSVALSVLALDGLAAVVLAAVIPNEGRVSESFRGPVDAVLDVCPPGLAFELGLERFPIGPDGAMSSSDGRYLMEQVVEAGVPVGLRNGDSLVVTPVPVETRCAWAIELDHPAQRALCPQPPAVIEVPVPVHQPPRPLRGPPPPQPRHRR